jgi:hypothetical protein
VRLQKAVHIGRQLCSDSIRGRDFLYTGPAQPFYGPKFSQQQVFAMLTNAWAIVENAFAHSLLH